MGGLAMGAWIAGRFTDGLERLRALRIYAALEGVIALCALAMPFAISAMRPLLAWAYADGAGGAVFDLTRLAASIALIALPGAAMGASFPVGVAAIRDSGFGMRDAKGARSVAELYAANTIGAAIGAALTGFVLLPSLGLFGTTIFGIVLNLVAAAGALILVRTQEPKNLKEPTRRTGPPEPNEPYEPNEPTDHRRDRRIRVRRARLRSRMDAGARHDARANDVRLQRDARRVHRRTGNRGRDRQRDAATHAPPGVWLGLSIIVAAAAALAAGIAADRLPIVIARTPAGPMPASCRCSRSTWSSRLRSSCR
jgi:MFS family permease